LIADPLLVVGSSIGFGWTRKHIQIVSFGIVYSPQLSDELKYREIVTVITDARSMQDFTVTVRAT